MTVRLTDAQISGTLVSGTLREHYGRLGISGLREIGRGLDARVYRADSAALGPVAIRVPHARWLNDGNDSELDSRLFLRQEYQLSEHLRAHGLPMPEMFVLHNGENGVDFTIARFVESDGSQLPDREFGRLIRAVHEVPAPPVELVCMESLGHADQVLARRIGQRLAGLATLAEVGPAPDVEGLLAASRPDSLPRRLLHMDLRPENILVRSGQAAALIDWSNALVGDPALDLARTAEYGSLTPAALAGYGDPGPFCLGPLNGLTARQAVYRLDTTVMLSHVFLSDAPDRERARHYIGRTRELCRLLVHG